MGTFCASRHCTLLRHHKDYTLRLGQQLDKNVRRECGCGWGVFVGVRECVIPTVQNHESLQQLHILLVNNKMHFWVLK